MKSISLPKNPYLLFLPFLLFYVVFVLILNTHDLWGDEIRHFSFAQNLANGFYSPPPPNVELTNGPGYPLIIFPFIALHFPLIIMKLLNAGFHYLSVVFLFKTLIQFVSFRKSLVVSLFWACYFNAFEFMALLYSETFTVFLVIMLIYCLVKAFDPNTIIKTKKYIWLSGLLIGYIALTKIIFGYVMLVMIIGLGILWLMNRTAANFKKSMVILLIAFATVSPYLAYTWHLTGRIYYWGTSGGNNLYWMTSTNENEYGSWFPDPKLDNDSTASGDENPMQNGGILNIKNRSGSFDSEDTIRETHRKDFEEINKNMAVIRDKDGNVIAMDNIERDDVFRKIAIRNIKSNPVKYVKNCFANVGRILFNYPYSYTLQKPGTLVRLPLNGIIVVLILLCLIPTLVNWKKIIFPIRFLLFFALIYLGGSVLGSAEIRMFTIIVPILLLWIAYIFERSFKISFTFDANTSKEKINT